MILVTGATGLVGSNLCWYLLQENEQITAICRPSSNLSAVNETFSFYTPEPEKYTARIKWVMADVLDSESLREALKGITTVYHCAAVVSLGGNANILSDTNIHGTRNIIDRSIEAGVNKFCFVSSIAACGNANKSKIVDEDSGWVEDSSRSSYSLSKYYSEQEVWRGIRAGLNAVIVNPGVILGFSSNDKGSSQLFFQVQKGLKFYTNGGSGYVAVQDVVKAMIRLTTSEISGERFILVAENCSNKDILGWMADGFGKRRPCILIGKKLLWIVGLISEVLGKIFQFQPLIDRGTARSATNREFYSNRKIKRTINFEFTPISKCIEDVCKFKISIN